MAKQKSKSLKFIVPAVLIGIVAVVAFGQFSSEGLTRRGPMAYEDAARKLEGFMGDVTWREEIVSQVATVELQDTSLEDSLPAIGTFPLVVSPRIGGALEVEIFASTEKSGSGTDGWMTAAAEDFNGRDFRLGDGRQVQISLRKIASGTGYQFIASRKYLPDAYSPSNHLWVRMAAARGTPMTPVRERTVGNIAGIVMKSEAARSLKQEVGELTVAKIVNAVVQGKLVTGYTNPYASSTGLNFLVTVLATFGDSDEARMLSPEVASAFEEFQRGIPFVALTTLQMRDSVRRDGSLDAFVMEYQTFVKTDELTTGYEFIPFGVAHDNPLYAVGNPDAAKREALELFAGFLERDKYKKLAGRYGFNPSLEHKPAFAIPRGETLIAAQRIWKEKKDAGRPIAAVFLSDVSGSMRGSRLRELKRALTEGSSFIASENSIGLVEFNHEVKVVLPIKPFELLHKSAFHSAVQHMEADGNTAMYDGIAVALSMLVEEKRKNPDVKPMLFVLTDGQTNRGLSFGKVDRVVEGLQIPVYTIGFEADIENLGRVSALVEAASLNAGEENLRYKIGSLLNSQM